MKNLTSFNILNPNYVASESSCLFMHLTYYFMKHPERFNMQNKSGSVANLQKYLIIISMEVTF